MPSIEQLTNELEELKLKINEKNNEVQDLIMKLNELQLLLKGHTHSGRESSGRIEPINFESDTINGGTINGGTINATTVFQANGTNGYTGTISVRNAAGTGACNIIVNKGIITSTTC